MFSRHTILLNTLLVIMLMVVMYSLSDHVSHRVNVELQQLKQKAMY